MKAPNEVNLLRRTSGYSAYRSRRGVQIIARDTKSRPRSRVVSLGTFEVLDRMSDTAFDGSCVLELGIGLWEKL